MLWNGHIVHASHQTSGSLTPRKKIGQRIFWNLLKHLGNTGQWHFLGIFWLKSRSNSTFGGIQLVGCSSSSSHMKPYKTETNRLPFQEQPLKTRRNTSRNIKKQPRNTLVTCNSQQKLQQKPPQNVEPRWLCRKSTREGCLRVTQNGEQKTPQSQGFP